MFQRFIKKLANHKTVVQNFGYLSILQIINLLIPLATYPYLIRVLGKETYGLVIYAQAVVSYFLILVQFGFNISAMNQVSIHRNDKKKLSEIVSAIFILKGVLFVFSTLLLFISLRYIPKTEDYYLLFMLCMWVCLYDVLFPIWYFQGIEKMQYITLITLISRVFFLVFIFILIHSPEDYLFVPILNGFGAILSGISSLFMIYKRHGLKFFFPKRQYVLRLFTESFTLFLSASSTRIYLNANKVVLGAFFGVSEVAYYDLGQKLLSVIKIPLALTTQSIFPKISKERNIPFLNKLMKYTFLGTTTIYVIIYILAPFVVEIIGGDQMKESIPVVRILSISVIIVGLSQFMGTVRLVPFGLSKQLAKAIVSSLFFYSILIGSLYLFGVLSLNSLAWSAVMVDLWVLIVLAIVCKNHNLF